MRGLIVGFIAIVLLSACGPAATSTPIIGVGLDAVPVGVHLPTQTALPTEIMPAILEIDPGNLPDYFPSVPVVGIRPIYDPRFANAQDVGL